MKVLMATMKLDIGGAETHIVELSKALKKRGVDVCVASAGGAYQKELEDAGIKHFTAPLSTKNPIDAFRSYRILKDIIVNEKIDVVHAHARIPAYICGLIKKTVDFRFVTTAHWVFSTKFPYNLLTNWGDRSLAVSDDIKKYLIDNYGINPGNIRVTINGIDTDKFSKDTDYGDIAEEFGLEPGKRRIVYVSRMDTDRSFAAHKLIEIAPRLYNSIGDYEMVIVGGGNDLENIKAEAEAANSAIGREVVKIAGARTDVNKFVASGDVFVGVSRAALEAMAAEKPSIIAGNEGYIGIFDEDKLKVSIDTNLCCRGCEQTTGDKLLKDLLTLFNSSKEELERLGSYSKATVEKYYSLRTMADDAIKMYISIIKYKPINDISIDEFEGIDEYLARPAIRKKGDIDAMISGYYGFHNSGDDSILRAIIEQLSYIKPDINILALSNKPKETRCVYGVNSIHRFNLPGIFIKAFRTKLLISGGGSLIQDITSEKSLTYYLGIIRLAKLCGVKVMLYANGIGPINNKRNYKRIRKVLDKVDLITLREESSKKELEAIGVVNPNVIVTADPAFTLAPVDDDIVDGLLSKAKLPDNAKYFCIAVRPWKRLDAEFEKNLATAAKYVKDEYGYEAVFIPMQSPKDMGISERISGMIPNTGYILSDSPTPAEILGVVARAEFIMGMRLHTLIYAAKMRTPVIGLIYDPKVESIMKSMGQKYALSVEELNPVTLEDFVDEVVRNKAQIVDELSEAGDKAIDLANENASLAIELIERRG